HLTGGKSGADVLLSSTALGGASWYDLVRGGLASLRASGGDFTTTTPGCFAEKVLAVTYTFAGPAPVPGDGFWFLVRGANCKGHGTYNDGTEAAPRDAGIAASGNDCP